MWLRIALSLCLCVMVTAAKNATKTPSAQLRTVEGNEFSFPPNNTPVTKVMIFGKPVYVRQPFVLPNRAGPSPLAGTKPLRDFRPPPMTQMLQKAMSIPGEDPIKRQIDYGHDQAIERSLLDQHIVVLTDYARDPYSPASPPASPSYDSAPAPPSPYDAAPSEDPYAPAAPAEDPYAPAEEDPYSPPVKPTKKYPLDSCYTNDSGFMCCNPQLEQVMKDVFAELTAKQEWQSCNVQKIANNLQNRTEAAFGTNFEAVAGVGDFASKTHFYNDLICKTEMQGRFMLAYATPNRHPRKAGPYNKQFTVRI